MKPRIETKHAGAKAPRRRRGRPTVADVASLAGVSPMTVSRVVNKSTFVSSDTVAKVEAAITRIGYVPNLAARELAGGQQCKLALLYSNPSSSYLSEFLMGCLDAAATGGAQLVIEKREDGETSASLIARLGEHRIDAVLLPPPLCDDQNLVAAISQRNWPIAQVATGAPSSGCISVSISDRQAMAALTRRIIAFGHRRIGFINGDPNQTVSAERLEGYRLAMTQAGIAMDPAMVADGDFTYRSGLAGADLLLRRKDCPTAILASNDDMAAGAIAAAHRLGLTVPGDVSVAGFDDTAMATSIWPELTTIHQPVAEMAREAARLLIEAVQARLSGNAVAPTHKVLDFALIERESAAVLTKL